MRKIIMGILIFALGIALGYLLVSHFNNTSKPVAQNLNVNTLDKKAEKKAPSFLFVVSAKKALLSYKDGKHTLTIKKDDLDKVIEFSDRPYRIVEKISIADLQALWPEGKNSFEKDPPNAVLSGANRKPSIVILTGMESTKDSIKYHFSISQNDIAPSQALNKRYIDIQSIVLTIDDTKEEAREKAREKATEKVRKMIRAQEK